MKRFDDLALLGQNPGTAFSIEDGMPECVDMAGYDGPRGLGETLAKTLRATELAELAAVAHSLNAGETRVLRISSAAGGSQVFGAGTHECLEQAGLRVFAICADDDAFFEPPENAVQARFVLLDAFEAAGEFGPRWAYLTAFEAAQRAAGVRLPAATAFQTPPALAEVDPDHWGLPLSVSDQQASVFARLVASRVGTYESLQRVLTATVKWLNRADVESIATFSQLVNAFVEEHPAAALPRLRSDL